MFTPMALPPPGPSDFETTMHDAVLGVDIPTSQIDAIFACSKFPSRFSYVSGAPSPPANPTPLTASASVSVLPERYQVQAFDSVLGKELPLPLIDGNFAVASFPSRYSYVIPNQYGADNPLANPVKLPPPGPSDFETTVHDAVLGVNVPMSQIDAIFACAMYPARFSWFSGLQPPFPAGIIVIGGMFNNASFSALLVPLGLAQ